MFSNRSKAGNQSGQTLMELIVVISVAVIVVGALVFATVASLRNAAFAKNQSQATKLAQEGIEKVRVGRDRNQQISGLPNVSYWNGDNSGANPIWNFQISNGACGNGTSAFCYFNVNDQGLLSFLTSASSIPSNTEAIPPAPAAAIFHRVVILSDSPSSYLTQKKVTVIVQWTDFSGTHQSILTTYLGNNSQ